MTGPTLAMASAVEASTPFYRSHSTPNLLSAAAAAAATPPSPAVESPRPAYRTNSLSLKSLPSLPAFDVPSFDLSSDFELSFSNFGAKPEPPRPSTAREKSFEIRTNTKPTVAAVTPADALSRTRSMIDRPRSWLPTSKSSPNVRAAQDHRPRKPPKEDVAGDAPEEALEPKPPIERSRTVESFADFAKRSWISTSRSPSPPSKADRRRGSDRASDEKNSTSKLKTVTGSRTVSGARGGPSPDGSEVGRATTELQSTTSRALNRASIYLTKMKQKPQNVFSRSSSSLSLSTSSVKSSISSESENTASLAPPSATTTSTATVSPALATPSATRVTSSTVPGGNVSHISIDSSSTPRHSSHTTSSIDTTATAATSEDSPPSATDTTGPTMPHPTSRDPLWATFRTLDTEFTKFAARNATAARMGAVRSTLVPFLRSTAHHPSNTDRSVLSVEDIDRRATVLSKWWNGLLEMLDAGQSRPSVTAYGVTIGSTGILGQRPVMATSLQPVAGVDRPTLLEATTMIMMRPEWRSITSYFQPLARRSPEERVRARSGTQSTTEEGALDMDASATFLAESAEHNVRTMFASNLLTQMALVVEKMSLRHAPLSLVNWCGKACAYAFFFVPGIADVLVRLWVVHGDLLRRAADEFGLPRRSKGESDDIVALFPPHLGKLGWTSAKGLGDKLRQAAKLPLMSARIPWHGPWVSRWRGADTDLFFIFCKYYYVLAEEFMPKGLPLVEKARAPAFVLLHAHLLSILDSTIHRQSPLDTMLGPPISDSADASAAGLLPFSSNLLKGMDENRLIILLKDMLAENSQFLTPGTKHTFAEAFLATAKAATKRTSRFDHAANFVLCDFLEETLVALDTFQNMVNNSFATSPSEDTASLQSFEMVGVSKATDYIDWPFWFEVCKMIMDSNNTMSEIRVISLLFSLWDAITVDPARKEALCVDWLLKEEVFEKFFNNWCPMVRAYYLRLLCWRVCRDSGSANELDTKIFLLVSERLRTVWSHYVWLQQAAEAANRVPPSTAPCYPTPGKRFLIIRTEVQPVPASLLPGFDVGLFPSLDMTTDFRSSFPANGGDSPTGSGRTDSSPIAYKKKWSLLGKVLSFTAAQANSGTGSAASSGKRTWDEELEQARRETAASRAAAARTGPPGLIQPSGPPPPPKQAPSSAVTSSSDSTSSTGSAPTYDASTFVFRFALTWQGLNGAGGGSPPQNRIIVRPRLPAPAQARVSSRSATLKANGAANGITSIRSESPPPVSPGLPPITRRVSGLMDTGLISEARNARPLSIAGTSMGHETEGLNDKRMSLGINVTAIRLVGDIPDEDDRRDIQSPIRVSGFEGEEFGRGRSFDIDNTLFPSSVRPVRPTGIYASGAAYAGRALAEWSVVVGECNNFVDRRRDEGVLGLNEVEVPTLGVEGLGIRQKA
ncbi:hypothetical protein B0H63DRAFT_401628 [Podospora didyma]|uniref:Uncharacterized protein n=1 Tax=Podospora didyma TaxID=330526 RepID=A0AAE0N6E0_9PEZI|nr:hypothetical protein B0H63DRAFT_401628 [Podospora didyma]